MECEACGALLSAMLDGELEASAEAAARAHVRSCERCERRWRRLLRVREGFQTLTAEGPSDTFARRTLESGRAGLPRRVRLTLGGLPRHS
jgi:anti-sigma factor RsiW